MIELWDYILITTIFLILLGLQGFFIKIMTAEMLKDAEKQIAKRFQTFKASLTKGVPVTVKTDESDLLTNIASLFKTANEIRKEGISIPDFIQQSIGSGGSDENQESEPQSTEDLNSTE